MHCQVCKNKLKFLKGSSGWYDRFFKNLVTFTGTDDDLEFYVRKCGEILGVTPKLDKDQRDAKHIMEHIFFQVVERKTLNQVRHP